MQYLFAAFSSSRLTKTAQEMQKDPILLTASPIDTKRMAKMYGDTYQELPMQLLGF